MILYTVYLYIYINIVSQYIYNYVYFMGDSSQVSFVKMAGQTTNKAYSDTDDGELIYDSTERGSCYNWIRCLWFVVYKIYYIF